MRKKQLLQLALLLQVMLLASWQLNAQFKVIGYMPAWAGDVNTVQYSKLTHINYAFILPTSTGGLTGNDNPSKLQSLVNKAHAANVKVLISIGGWNDGNDSGFEGLAASSTYRNNFVTNVVNFINQYNLDGADIDWEYPDDGASSANYTALMQQLSTEMHNRGQLLTAAVVGINGSSISSTVFGAVDFLNVMAYDYNNFDHSTYDYATQSINYWKGRGLPASKTVLGVPFYGRPSWETFAQLVARGADPYADVFGTVGYNGITTIKRKTNLAFDQGNGIMIWELSGDATGANSLLSAINQVVVDRGGGNPPVTGVIEAESYSSMSGVQLESTTDAGGGSNVGYIDAGDYMNYSNVNFPTTGTYKIEYRVASLNGGGSLTATLNSSTTLGTVSVPATGGWQSWTTILQTVSVNAGTYTLGISAPAGGWNCNWFKITALSTTATTIQAENYNNMAGVQTEATTDEGGGSNVAYIDATDWMAYYNISFPATGSYKFEYRVASLSGGGQLSLDLNAGAIQLGVVNVPSTGGWQSWTTISHTVHVTAGTYNVGIYAPAGGWNINWFRITPVNGSRQAAPVKIEPSFTTVAEANSLVLYPNPVQGTVYLKGAFVTAGSKVRVLDMAGREVLNTNVQSGAVNVSSLPKGVYTLVLMNGERIVAKQFIK